jgi:hypothetical protein
MKEVRRRERLQLEATLRQSVEVPAATAKRRPRSAHRRRIR